MSSLFKFIQTTLRRFVVLFAALLPCGGGVSAAAVLQAVNAANAPDMEIMDVSSVNIPPPPPPVEEEEQKRSRKRSLHPLPRWMSMFPP